jgi:hypothetical protein
VEWEHDGYVISSDSDRLNVEVVHDFLGGAYPAQEVPRAVVERAIENSLLLGLYAPGGEQVGLARVLSDPAAVVYLADVFVREGHSSQRRWLLETVLSHPDLEGMEQVELDRAGAHSLHVFQPTGSEHLATLNGRDAA